MADDLVAASQVDPFQSVVYVPQQASVTGDLRIGQQPLGVKDLTRHERHQLVAVVIYTDEPRGALEILSLEQPQHAPDERAVVVRRAANEVCVLGPRLPPRPHPGAANTARPPILPPTKRGGAATR